MAMGMELLGSSSYLLTACQTQGGELLLNDDMLAHQLSFDWRSTMIFEFLDQVIIDSMNIVVH